MKFNRQDIGKLYADLEKGETHPVYLVFGERFLCQQVASEITKRLLPEEKNRVQNLTKVAGEQEDINKTIITLRTFSLFGGRQVVRVNDSTLFLSKAVGKNVWNKAKKAYDADDRERAGQLLAQLAAIGGLTADDQFQDLSKSQWQSRFGFSHPSDLTWSKDIDLPPVVDQEKGGDNAAQLMACLEHGIPAQNHLLIICETMDKRKKLFGFIDKVGVIVDLAVASGITSAARKGQDAVIRELVSNTLREMGKKPGPKVMDLILERVGFHPVAAVREAEKLALYCGEQEVIQRDDVDAVTSKSREEALFELNDAVASRNLAQSLLLLKGLLNSGLHSLVIVATMRNLLRKLLFFRALQEQDNPRYNPGQAYGPFQKGYLAAIKTEQGDSEFLKGHPFVVYKGFQQAEKFSLPTLRLALSRLLATEYKLKSSGSQDNLLLENFFFATLL